MMAPDKRECEKVHVHVRHDMSEQHVSTRPLILTKNAHAYSNNSVVIIKNTRYVHDHDYRPLSTEGY